MYYVSKCVTLYYCILTLLPFHLLIHPIRQCLTIAYCHDVYKHIKSVIRKGNWQKCNSFLISSPIPCNLITKDFFFQKKKKSSREEVDLNRNNFEEHHTSCSSKKVFLISFHLAGKIWRTPHKNYRIIAYKNLKYYLFMWKSVFIQ